MREPAVDERAEALVEERRFCEWLDATAAMASGWPHSPVSARWWLLQECEVERLRDLAQDPAAAAAFEEISRRYVLWDQNGELEV